MPVVYGPAPCYLSDGRWRRLPPIQSDWRPGAEGRTGLVFVDACMRILIATGWINFRMRAMLLPVATHHLGLPWWQSGRFLPFGKWMRIRAELVQWFEEVLHG